MATLPVRKILQQANNYSAQIAARRLTEGNGLSCPFCGQEMSDVPAALVGDGSLRVQVIACRNVHCGKIWMKLVET